MTYSYPDIYAQITKNLPPSPELDDFLSKNLPGLIDDFRNAVQDRKISADEAKILIGRVSAAVRAFPALTGTPARNVVIAVYSALFDAFLAPALPGWLRPVAGLIKRAAANLLEMLYQRVIKPASKT